MGVSESQPGWRAVRVRGFCARPCVFAGLVLSGALMAGCAVSNTDPLAAAPGQAATATDESDSARLLAGLARSYYPGRVGDIAIIPRERDMLTSPAPDDRFMHGSPWDYDTRIPVILYGSAYLEPGSYDAEVSHQDIGATLFRLLGLPVPRTATGRPLEEALRPADTRPRPKIVAVLVLDAFRPDYLERYASQLPTLRRLREAGAWYGNARIDYLPTATSIGHTTLMTAAGARVHGISGNSFFNRESGRSERALGGASPANIMVHTLADEWSRHTGGRSIIYAQAGTYYPAAALAGHAACEPGGFTALAAYYDSGSGRLLTNDACYTLPSYLKDRDIQPLLEEADGEWMGHDITDPGWFRYSALFSRFEGETALQVLQHEPFGADAVTDLYLANFKASDYVTHMYGPSAPETEAMLAEVDRQVARILALLEEKAGPDGFALLVVSDHGMPSEPEPDRERHFYSDVAEAVNERFDPGGPGIYLHLGGAEHQLYLDHDRLDSLGVSVGEVADFLEDLPWVRATFTEAEVRQAADRLPVRH